MKKFLSGFLCACVLLSVPTVYANIQEYILTKLDNPIIVNGQVYSNSHLPALNYDGNTYVPLKAMGEMLDVTVKWNDELKQVEVGNTSVSNSILQPDPEILEFDGTKYLEFSDILRKYTSSKNYTYYFEMNSLYKRTDSGCPALLLSEMPIMRINGKDYIEYSYYTKNVKSTYMNDILTQSPFDTSNIIEYTKNRVVFIKVNDVDYIHLYDLRSIMTDSYLNKNNKEYYSLNRNKEACTYDLLKVNRANERKVILYDDIPHFHYKGNVFFKYDIVLDIIEEG